MLYMTSYSYNLQNHQITRSHIKRAVRLATANRHFDNSTGVLCEFVWVNMLILSPKKVNLKRRRRKDLFIGPHWEFVVGYSKAPKHHRAVLGLHVIPTL